MVPEAEDIASDPNFVKTHKGLYHSWMVLEIQ